MEINNENISTSSYDENIREKIKTNDGTTLLILNDNLQARNNSVSSYFILSSITIETLEAFANKTGWSHEDARVDFQNDFEEWETEYNLLEGRKVGIAEYTFNDNHEYYYTIMSYEQLYNYLEIEVRDKIEEYGEQHENVVIVKNALGIIKGYSGYNIKEENYRRVNFSSKEQAIAFARDRNMEVLGYEERTLSKSLEKVRINLEISEDRYDINGDKPWYSTKGYVSSTKDIIKLDEQRKQEELLRQIEEMVKKD